MKLNKLYTSLLVGLLVFTSCEKDDLCEGTDNQTPRLHISLFDQYNADNKKNADYIKAYIPGNEKYIEYNSVSDFYLPLNTTTSSTEWTLELYDVNGTEKTLIGTENILFNYAPENIYISKACGFKTNYNAFSYSRTSNSWIGGISLTTNNITDESNTHLQIYY